jgi:hypothetical protein
MPQDKKSAVRESKPLADTPTLRSERMMERGKKVLNKANIALDEGRMGKEKRLLAKSEGIIKRAKIVENKEKARYSKP